MNNDSLDRENQTVEIKSRSRLFALLSLVFGILSAILSTLGAVGIVLGVCAVICSVISRARMSYFDSLSLIGLIAAIIGVVAGGTILVANELFGQGFMNFS